MIASVIPFQVIALCNVAHIVLALFYFHDIIVLLEDIRWGFTHRPSFIELGEELDFGVKKHISHSECSILVSKADRYERNERLDFVSYYSREDKNFNEYLRCRDNQKMQKQAADTGLLVKKQNFRVRVQERMVEQPVLETRKLARTR